MPTTWKTPYKNWTARDILVANLLRPEPLPYPSLCDFSGHGLPTLHTAMNNLKREGRVTRENELVTAHPANQRMSNGLPFSPLPDPGLPPNTRAVVEGHVTASRIAQDASGSLATPFDRQVAARILEQWISEGSAGKDTPRFIQVWSDLVGSSYGSGPPPPTTDTTQRERLVRCMTSVRPAVVRSAIAEWEALLANEHPRPSAADLRDPDLVDSSGTMGTGDPRSAGQEPPPPAPGLPLEDSLR